MRVEVRSSVLMDVDGTGAGWPNYIDVVNGACRAHGHLVHRTFVHREDTRRTGLGHQATALDTVVEALEVRAAVIPPRSVTMIVRAAFT